MSIPNPHPGPDPAPVPAPTERLAALRARLAPRWINAPPLLVAPAVEGAPPELVFIALADRAVLLVFWDYTCALSLRTVPFLTAWHDRYSRFGLTIVGVHAPEFRFGAERRHVEREVARLGIRYPIVLDNDLAITRALDNQAWPRTLLLDRSGQIVLDHAGASGYAQIASHVVTALAVGRNGAIPPAPAAPATPATIAGGASTLPATPDLYCGFLRQDVEYHGAAAASGEMIDYPEAGQRASDRIYPSGCWRATRESLIAMPTPGKPATLRVRATAAEVGAVLGGGPGGTELRVLLNGRPVPRERTGTDLGRGEGGAGDPGAGILRAAEPRLYRLVRGPLQITLELALVVTAGELEVFALRFQGGLKPQDTGQEPAGRHPAG
jgi:hypothetical protein